FFLIFVFFLVVVLVLVFLIIIIFIFVFFIFVVIVFVVDLHQRPRHLISPFYPEFLISTLFLRYSSLAASLVNRLQDSANRLSYPVPCPVIFENRIAHLFFGRVNLVTRVQIVGFWGHDDCSAARNVDY